MADRIHSHPAMDNNPHLQRIRSSFEAICDREVATNDMLVDEQQRGREQWQQAHAEFEQFERNAAYLPEYRDIDPVTGKWLDLPEVYDASGNKVQNATALDGRPHFRTSDRLVRRRQDEDSRARFDALTARCKAKKSQAWRQHADPLNTFLAGLTDADIQPATPPRGFEASLRKFTAAGEKAVALAARIKVTGERDDPLEEILKAIDGLHRQNVPPFKLKLPDHRHRTRTGKRRRPSIEWASVPILGTESTSVEVSPVAGDIEALAFWLAGDRIIEVLKQQARDAYADGRETMSAADRAATVKRLKAELHAVELEEAFHLWGLVEQGMEVRPRADISPKALLLLA